jgi:hypothetical protein
MPDYETAAAEKVQLTGWGTFEDLANGILAKLFGEMILRAIPVIHEYHSDLFHDAEWIRAHVTGETTFDWMVRPSGTNIGSESVAAQQSIGPGAGAITYHIAITCERGMWYATFG